MKSVCYDVKLSMEVNIWEDCWILYHYQTLFLPFPPKKKKKKKKRKEKRNIILIPLGTIPNKTCWIFSIKNLKSQITTPYSSSPEKFLWTKK